MNAIAFEALIIFLLVMINGFFALAEIAIVSARKSRLRQEAGRGNRQAQAAVSLSEEPSTFLSSVQVGITLVGIISGAFGGATLARHLAPLFERVPFLADHADTAGVVVVIGFILFLSVVLGELVPKQLALTNPERFAMLVALPMQFISRVTSPLVRLLGESSRIVLTSLGISQSKDSAITDEEVAFIVEEGVQSGAFEPVESRMVERALHLDDQNINLWMVPRVDIVWLDVEFTDDQVREKLLDSAYNAYPVCRGSVDRVIGTAYARDIYRRLLQGQPALSPEIIRQPLIIPAGTKALRAIDMLRQSGEHLGIIMNEYGGVEGLFTAMDVLKSLLGQGAFMGAPLIVTRDDGSLLVDGQLPVYELEYTLHKDIIPAYEKNYYRTVAGFILHRLGRMPQIGDSVIWSGYRFEVVDMDGSRIDRILVQQE